MAGPSYGTRFPAREPVDVLVVGSGAAGGVLARELARSGLGVLVLEQGPWRDPSAFTHDELGVIFNQEMTGGWQGADPQTFRRHAGEEARPATFPPPAFYARTVGGSSVHYSANSWRFRPVDFRERSLLGEIPGTGFADWPLTYEELEPFYTRAEWELGVSGAPGPFDAPRSKPYPLPPMPVKSSGVLFERGARALGLHPQAAPVAILSRPYRGRAPCHHCGFCLGFGCEVGAKSSTLATMIPEALATGRCEIRTGCTVHRLETDDSGRISEVLYFDERGVEHAQRARTVVLAGNGAETPRLLLLSESARHPGGLANGSGLVGKYLMFNAHAITHALFDEPLNEYKSIQCTRMVHDFYETDPERGHYGGGGLDGRPMLDSYPIFFAMFGTPEGTPAWGLEFKRHLRRDFTRNMVVLGSGTNLPLATNNVTLDPVHRDRFGRPGLRITYREHPDDLANVRFLQDRAVEIMEAAGASRVWREPVAPESIGAHLLGTCRMGDDPDTSVVDRDHRSHEVPNLFICDGSSFVSSGRGQPTLTIQALAFRAADRMTALARRGQL